MELSSIPPSLRWSILWTFWAAGCTRAISPSRDGNPLPNLRPLRPMQPKNEKWELFPCFLAVESSPDFLGLVVYTAYENKGLGPIGSVEYESCSYKSCLLWEVLNFQMRIMNTWQCRCFSISPWVPLQLLVLYSSMVRFSSGRLYRY